jgi:putative SOS response-associated peptidase YedK
MSISVQAVAAHFGLSLPELKPSPDVESPRSIAVVRLNPQSGQRELVTLHWGLIPPTAKGVSIDDRLVYARAETVTHKPPYREAFHARRCLVPADGFCEWKRDRSGKQLYFIRLRTGHLLALGGLWERWEGPQGKTIESCVILTTEANELVRTLHPRMPLIIRPEHYGRWLDSRTAAGDLEPLLHHYPAREMTAYPVSLQVNQPIPDQPELVEPMEPQPGEASGAFHPLYDEVSHRKPRSQPSPDRGSESNA